MDLDLLRLAVSGCVNVFKISGSGRHNKGQTFLILYYDDSQRIKGIIDIIVC